MHFSFLLNNQQVKKIKLHPGTREEKQVYHSSMFWEGDKVYDHMGNCFDVNIQEPITKEKEYDTQALMILGIAYRYSLISIE